MRAIDPDDDGLRAGPGLGEFLSALRRRAWIIILCLLAVPGAALAYSLQREKQYESTSQVLLRSSGLEDAVAAQGLASGVPASDPPDLATDAALASLRPIARSAAREVGDGLTAAAVAASITVTTSGEANLLSFTATDTDPKRAALIADAYARRYIAFRRGQDRGRVRSAQVGLERRSKVVERTLASARAKRGRQLTQQRAQRSGRTLSRTTRRRLRLERADTARAVQTAEDQLASLDERRTQLATLEGLQTGDAALVSGAEVATAPSSPNITRNVLAGVAVGLLLGILLAVFFEVLDRRVRHPEELEQMFERPILGAIPRSRALARGSSTAMRLPAVEKEAFRKVQSTLRYAAGDQPVHSVMVTSASAGEGKSTVAWNLAAAAADGGASVLLIEADLRRGSLADRLGLHGETGLTDVVAGGESLVETVHQVSVGAAEGHMGDVYAPVSTIDVLLGGRRPRNPPGVLASAAMAELLREAVANYDFVVVDTPPTGVVSDAIPLIHNVSGILVVTRMRQGTREASEHLRDQLRNLKAPTLGLVVNSVGTRDARYGPGYAAIAEYAGAGSAT